MLQTIIVSAISTGPFTFDYFNFQENLGLTDHEYLFGIDISHHQGKIIWWQFNKSHHPIEYIFIKATEGETWKDKRFKSNWENAKKHGYVRGAYHFYNPAVNSEKQFNNYKASVSLDTGDFIPILDVETIGSLGQNNLVKGVLNWLKLAEKHYGKKPMLYTGKSFYNSYLKGYVSEYPLWIAAYDTKKSVRGIDWKFHQFTDQVRIKGIRHRVDGNDFRGSLEELKNMCF